MPDTQQQSQKEAIQKNELPEGTAPELTPVEQYSKENDQVKDKLAEYGETDLEHFLAKMTSNAVYAKQVLRHMLGLNDDKPFVNLEHKTSPQEGGTVTGTLDRTSFPFKLKGGPEGKVSDSVNS